MSRMSTHYAGNSPAMSSHNQGRFDKLCSICRSTPSIGTEVLNTICKSLQGETCPQIFGFLPSPKFPSQLAVNLASIGAHGLTNMQITTCMSQHVMPRLYKHVYMHATFFLWSHVLLPTASHGLMHACM